MEYNNGNGVSMDWNNIGMVVAMMVDKGWEFHLRVACDGSLACFKKDTTECVAEAMSPLNSVLDAAKMATSD